MIKNADIWTPFLHEKLETLRSFPIINQCAHDWRNRSALTVCEIGLSGFFMFKFLAPALHKNINWTLYHPARSDIISREGDLIRWASQFDMQLQSTAKHERYTFHNAKRRWHIELKPYDDLSFFLEQNLTRYNLFALSFGLCDLSLETVQDLFRKCYRYNMAVFLGPLYDGTFHWIPEADGDGDVIDHFHESLKGTSEEPSGGVRATRSASTLLSHQGFNVRESEHIFSTCQQQHSFMRHLINNMKREDVSAIDTAPERWSSTRFYMLAANKLKARIGFRFAYAKPVK